MENVIKKFLIFHVILQWSFGIVFNSNIYDFNLKFLAFREFDKLSPIPKFLFIYSKLH